MLRFIILIFGLLTSCSAHVKQTHQSTTYTPQKIQKPYSINGVRYEPLSSHEGFVQAGVASWYGSDFHGRKTSNGEIYDMNALTAAHKTLPFGVYVKVSNRNNGRETVVKINDRGPFSANRIIDLSFSAAKNLGVVDSGTAPVTIEALGYFDKTFNGKAIYKPPVSYDTGSFGIQVGSFTKQENALKMAADIKKRHGASSIKEFDVKGVHYYRVRAGNYTSLTAAEQSKSRSPDKAISEGIIVALD